MTKHFLSITLFFCLIIKSTFCLSTDYFVSSSGNDVANNGNINAPWKTIAFACKQVKPNQGHVINLSEGIFEETQQIIVPSGVNIIGGGKEKTKVNVKFYFDFTTRPTKCLYAPNQTSYHNSYDKFVIQLKGKNQTIKGFELDGLQKQCHGGIFLDEGSNLIFEDLYIHDFRFSGLWVDSASNTKISKCNFLNNAYSSTVLDVGNILLFQSYNVEIFDCDIRETGLRGGHAIKFFSKMWTSFCSFDFGDYNSTSNAKNVRIYNNNFQIPELNGYDDANTGALYTSSAIETNGAISLLELDIHHNTTNAQFSILDNQSDGKPYIPMRIHHNYFNLGRRFSSVFYTEASNIEFDHNLIDGGLNNVYTVYSNISNRKNILFHHNIFISGWRNEHSFVFASGFSDLKFYHNTFIDTKGIIGYINLKDVKSVLSNPDIRNNLFISTRTVPAELLNTSLFQNSIIANNGFENIIAKGINPVTGPMGVNMKGTGLDYFSLISTSAAIDKGQIISGINTDYKGKLPDLGALEYGDTLFKVGSQLGLQPTALHDEEVTNLETFKIIPNPNNGSDFIIENPVSEYAFIYNMQGVLLNKIMTNKFNKLTLPSGMYYVKSGDGNRSEIHKMLVK